jgi:hypothetical protein
MSKQYKPTQKQIEERDAFNEMARLLNGEVEQGTHTERVRQIAQDTPGLTRFSQLNQMLIIKQMPEASDCHTYLDWIALGYKVRHGEHAIWITAPYTKTGDNGQEKVTGFHRKPVFDISQCDKIEEAE